LWTTLGELYLAELPNVARALVAFEVAARLDPGNLDRSERLAALYSSAGPTYHDQAINEHQTLLRADPLRLSSYHALQSLYRATHQPDKALACAHAAWLLQPEGPPPPSSPNGPLQRVRRPLREELWAALRHPDEDPRVSAVFAIVAPVVAAARAQRQATPLPRERLVAPGDKRPAPNALRLAAHALGSLAPELEIVAGQAEDAVLSVCVDGSVVAPLLRVGGRFRDERRSEVELSFLAGYCAAFLRRERLLRWLLPLPEQLAHMLEAAIMLSGSSRGGASPVGELATTVDGLRRQLTPMALDQLAGLGDRLGASKATPFDLSRQWLVASDRTACRAGLALAGDLAVATRVLDEAPPPPGDSAAPRKVSLAWSSATEEFFRVTAHLSAELRPS
jgi:tetratricopeptide (TPR) repeat protein